MSIAAAYREKWETILAAADSTHGQGEDRVARYAVMARAADRAGLILTSKEVIAAYQKRIAELGGGTIPGATTSAPSTEAG